MTQAYLSFDLWETLLAPNLDYKYNRNAVIADRFNCPDSVVNAEHYALKQTLDTMNSYGVSLSTKSCWDMLSLKLETLGYRDLGTVDLCDEMQRRTILFPPKLIVDVQWLNNLIKNHKVHILSNTNMISGNTLREILNSLGVLTQSRKLLFSDEWGYSKPSREFFAQLRFPSNQYCVHIGDSDCDKIGARMYGIDFVRVTNRNTQKVVDKWLAENVL